MTRFLPSWAVIVCLLPGLAAAQTPPSPSEIAAYSGLHAMAWTGDVDGIRRLVAGGDDVNARDGAGRTPLHVAAFASQDGAVRALAAAGGDPNLLENGLYDIITIAAGAGDADMVRLAVAVGGNPGNVTSIYDGTALIAAAHLGHVAEVKALIEAGAPLDHVNNLGWTALIEAVVLGDGGPRHTETLRALVAAGADIKIGDRDGVVPLEHARQRGYGAMVAILERAAR